MNHQYHIQTPFSRDKNLEFYLKNIEPLGVIWHPIFDLEKKDKIGSLPQWVRPLFCPSAPDKWYIGNFKSNFFARHGDYNDNDRIVLINDDDWIEPDFFPKIDAVDGEFLITGMKRGDTIGITGYPTYTLEASKEFLSLGGIGGEQIVLSGHLQRQYRWDSTCYGDWLLIAELLVEHDPTFVPNCYAWFNYLEPKRWNGVVIP